MGWFIINEIIKRLPHVNWSLLKYKNGFQGFMDVKAISIDNISKMSFYDKLIWFILLIFHYILRTGFSLENIISYDILFTRNGYDTSIIHEPLVSICYEGLVFRAQSNSWIGWKYTTSKESKTIKSTLYTSVSHYHNIIRGQKVGIFWFDFERDRKHSWHDCSV